MKKKPILNNLKLRLKETTISVVEQLQEYSRILPCSKIRVTFCSDKNAWNLIEHSVLSQPLKYCMLYTNIFSNTATFPKAFRGISNKHSVPSQSQRYNEHLSSRSIFLTSPGHQKRRNQKTHM